MPPGAPSLKEGAISPSLNPVSASSLIDTAEGLGPMSGRACDSYIKQGVQEAAKVNNKANTRSHEHTLRSR